jgi:hypothetical protein
MGIVYEKILRFKNKYPSTFALRLKKHAEVAEKSLMKGEKVYEAYCACNENFRSYAIVITDKRIILAHKNLMFGYHVESISKDKIYKIDNEQGFKWSEISLNSLTETIANFCYLDHSGALKMKEDIIQHTIVSNINAKENNSQRTVSNQVQHKRASSLSINEQIEMCKQLDYLYREKYNIETDPTKRRILKAKLWNNYNLYLSLTGETPKQVENNQAMTLKKTNNY